MRIGVGADLNAFELKELVKAHLTERGHEVVDYGVKSEQDIDYPDVAEPVARAVASGELDRAVLVCGTGLGMAIVANKVHGVRAAPVTDPYSAERAIKSNNAKVLCLGCAGGGQERGPAAGRPLAGGRVRRWWLRPQGGQDRGA